MDDKWASAERLAKMEEDGTTRHHRDAMDERLAGVDEDGTTRSASGRPEARRRLDLNRAHQTGRRAGWPAGVAGAVGVVAGQEDGAKPIFLFAFSIFPFSFIFLIFNWADKWALLSMSASLFFLCQLGAHSWVPSTRFGVNSLSIHDQCKLRIITRKVVVFCD
jgi:hypothetical protein